MPIADFLRNAAAEKNFFINENVIFQMSKFFDMLCKVNENVNLTRITDEADAARKHFLDSLAPLWLNVPIENGAAIIDVGAGAGFPGIPLAIIRNDLELTLLDSVRKKTDFINNAAQALNINVKTIHARSEDLAKTPEHREKYDIALARAVASLAVLMELTLPFIKLGGKLLAWKGPAPEDEIDESKKALTALGGEIIDVVPYTLAEADEHRTLVIIGKIRHTSPNFPRKAGTPRNSPIGVKF